MEVDESAAVGTAAQTAALVERQSQIAMVLQCAEVVGILDTVVDFTVQWAFDRHSFGRPLASYQALKHRFADLKMYLEACRATTRAAVGEVANRSPGAEMAVSVAKSYVGERAPGMIQDCVQLHGGIGVTWEHDLHLFLRRATLYRSMLGTPEDHNLRGVRADQGTGVRVMTETTSAPTETTESVAEFGARASGLARGEHAAHRPERSARGRARRRGAVAACPRTAEEALRRRIRGNLLSP